jgi:hypothetical protein
MVGLPDELLIGGYFAPHARGADSLFSLKQRVIEILTQ